MHSWRINKYILSNLIFNQTLEEEGTAEQGSAPAVVQLEHTAYSAQRFQFSPFLSRLPPL